MHAIVVEREADHERVHAEHRLEVADDGDRAARADVEARARLAEKLPTCGLVVIDLPFDDWSRLNAQAGRLERFVSPRLIESAAD